MSVKLFWGNSFSHSETSPQVSPGTVKQGTTVPPQESPGAAKGAPRRRQTGRRGIAIVTGRKTRAVSPAGYARGMFFLRLFY